MYEKQQLLEKIKDLENELKKIKSCKRYGLVFEEKTEQFEEKAKNALPLLKEEKELEIKAPPLIPLNGGGNEERVGGVNLIIEGDNYHSLSCLQFTHKNKIDVIYIDPPYNTGNKDFIYNDSFVDKEDSFRHSKWLSFMKKRLVLGKELLSEKGVIFISIDDNEFAQLKMLCDEIFGEEKSIGPIIWQKASGGGNSKKVVKGHEYLLCYSNFQLTLTQKNEKHKNIDFSKSSKYLEKNGDIFFINDDIIRKVFGKYENGVERRCEYEDLLIYKNEKVKKEIDEKIKNGEYILIPNPNNPSKNFICRLEKLEGKRMKLYSIVFGILNNEGKQDLENLGFPIDIFDYPKPKNLVKFLLDSIEFKSSIILDFFAGSGTTGHAVLELNREDGGNRQFILCSNRENTKENPLKNICKNITYERNKRVIEGYINSKGEKVNGLGGNLKYYTTDFIKIDKSREDLKTKFKNNCNDLLCIKENTFTKVELKKEIPGVYIFKNDSSFTIISYEQIYLQEIKDICKILNKKVNIYIFSLSNYFSEDFIDIKDSVEIKNIPETILETYQKIFNF